MSTRLPGENPRFHVPPTYVRRSEPLPYPAKTLVISQHLFVSHCGRYWAWLIVGTFYDRDDKAIWNSEVFLAMMPQEEDSDDESDEDSGTESAVYGSRENELGSEDEVETLVFGSDFDGESSLTDDEGRDEGMDAHSYQAARRALFHLSNMSGNNPLHGRDEGPRIPGHYYVPSYYYPAWAATYPTNNPLPPGSPIPPGPVYATTQPNGAGNFYARSPHPFTPSLDPSIPAAQLRNTTGGTGCEPGYNYFFSPSHTKIHVFKTATPPWQLPAGAHIPFHAVHVPTGTTLAEILRGFGADNPVPKKNRCYEIVQGGGGRWYKGMSFGGDEKDVGKTTIGEIGWDESRNGQPGGKPVVCIYLTKD